MVLVLIDLSGTVHIGNELTKNCREALARFKIIFLIIPTIILSMR